ncbi:MAG: hypothetical protein KIT09_30450 [Bryobacteraceae bacterium]|nr:hypothetical protein [Bryobacteraceae bacterium]
MKHNPTERAARIAEAAMDQVFGADETKPAGAAKLARTEVIEILGQKILDIETLETRNRDGLDFYELAVWKIRTALEAAYEAGLAQGARK